MARVSATKNEPFAACIYSGNQFYACSKYQEAANQYAKVLEDVWKVAKRTEYEKKLPGVKLKYENMIVSSPESYDYSLHHAHLSQLQWELLEYLKNRPIAPGGPVQ